MHNQSTSISRLIKSVAITAYVVGIPLFLFWAVAGQYIEAMGTENAKANDRALGLLTANWEWIALVTLIVFLVISLAMNSRRSRSERP